ncbi:hypothetical protein IJE86_01265 [bacterium]|nr:hypothetical protein [bacterium]
MATQGSMTTGSSYNRSLTFNWWLDRQDIAGNYTVIGWEIVGSGSATGYVKSGNFDVWVSGTNLYNSSDRINLYNGTVVASGKHTLYHDNNGNRNFTAYIEAGIWSTAVNCWQEQSWDLPQIPRYANITSFSVSKRNETSVLFNWSADANCDWAWYSTDNGSTWHNLPSSNIVSGLSPNTTYNFKLRLRRTDSQLTTDSSTYKQTTYDYPHCTNSPNFTLGEELTLTLYNPLNRSVTLNVIGADGSTLSTDIMTGTSIKGFVTEKFINNAYASIPNNSSGKYKVEVIYEGITKTRDNNNMYSVDLSQCKPIFNNFTYKDINTVVTNVTGNNQVLVKGKSNLQVTISSSNKMVAQKSATPNKYIAVIDTLNVNANYSENDVTFDVGTVINSGSKRLTVTAYDSRNNDTSVYKDIMVYDYSKPVINVDVARLNNFESQTTLKINGTYTKLTIDNSDKNSIVSVQYRYREKEGTWSNWVTVNTTLTSGKFTCSDIILSLDNTKPFDIEVMATDKLDSDVASGSIDVGEAIFFISSNKKKCYINNKQVMTGIAEDVNRTDLNNYINDFVAGYGHNLTNAPSNEFNLGHFMSIPRHDAEGYVTQLFSPNSTDDIYIRKCNGGTWGEWSLLAKEGKVLYDNSTGANGTITLNDNATNYKYLEIFYGNNTIISTKTLVTNGKKILLSQSYVEDTGWYFVYYEELTINNNSLVGGKSNRVDFNVNGMTTYNSTQMKVFKVIGYK